MSEAIFDSAVSKPVSEVTPIDAVLNHLEFARKYTLSLIDDLPEECWFKQPAEGITHIAWQVGHIAMGQYGLALFRQRGRAEVDLDLMTGSFRKKFSKGTTPDSDPGKYPEPAEIREVFDRVYQQVKLELPGFAQENLDQPVDPPHAAFSSNYGALMFAVDHEMLHAGQIGLLRRLIGLPPVR